MEKQFVIYLIVFFVSFVLFFAAVVLLFRQYRQKQQAAIRETAMREQVHRQEMLEARLEIQQQTMQYIGREIHDNIGQQLTLAALYTQQLDYENKAPQVKLKIENISNIINQSLAELRQLSKSLTDDTIATNSIVALLEKECEKVNELKQCGCVLHCDLPGAELSYQTKNILLRIVQEFIQNSLKHASCKNIGVGIRHSGGLVHLTMQDDGTGFDTATENTNGIGIRNMKKRAGLIGGTFDLQSSPHGTSATIEIPLS
jgi:signal transduction histidine kinase